MQRLNGSGSGEPAPVVSVDRWLRFDPMSEAAYEAERGRDRAKHLSFAMLIGVVFFNFCMLPAAIIMPDIAWFSTLSRVAGFTPIAVFLSYMVLHATPVWRERMMAGCVTIGMLVTLLMYWVTQARFGPYLFGELLLVLVFANMFLALRFRHAAVFTGVSLVACALVFLLKPEAQSGLSLALVTYIFAACAFSVAEQFHHGTATLRGLSGHATCGFAGGCCGHAGACTGRNVAH